MNRILKTFMLLGMTSSVAFADSAPVVVGHLAGDETTSSAPQQTLVTADNASATESSGSTAELADQQYQSASSGLAQEAAIPVQNTVQPNNNLANQSSLSLLQQVQTMQQQMRDMQGQLELQAHQLQVLQHAQAQDANELASKISALANGNKQAALQPLSVSSTSAQGQIATPTGLQNPTSVAQATDKVAQPLSAQEAQAVLAEEKNYQAAYNLLANKQYAQAQAGMQDYIKKYPNGKFAANAHYWLGELALISGNTKQALTEFGTVTNKFADSQKAADAMLKTGLIYYNEHQLIQAENQLKTLIHKYPDSNSAQMAKQKLQLIQSSGNS